MPFGIPSWELPAETQVGLTPTPITAGELYTALAKAWPTVVGGQPTREALVLMVAHSAIETTHWQKGIFNFNIGNIRHSPGDSFAYHTMRCTEYVSGQPVTLPDCPFRAYANLDAAAADYLSLLYRKFQFAWHELERGDAGGFAHKLKVGHYYTDSEEHYSMMLRSSYRRYDKALIEQQNPDGSMTLVDYSVTDAAPELVTSAPPKSIAAGMLLLGVGVGLGAYLLFTRFA